MAGDDPTQSRLKVNAFLRRKDGTWQVAIQVEQVDDWVAQDMNTDAGGSSVQFTGTISQGRLVLTQAKP